MHLLFSHKYFDFSFDHAPFILFLFNFDFYYASNLFKASFLYFRVLLTTFRDVLFNIILNVLQNCIFINIGMKP